MILCILTSSSRIIQLTVLVILQVIRMLGQATDVVGIKLFGLSNALPYWHVARGLKVMFGCLIAHATQITLVDWVSGVEGALVRVH